MRQPKIMTTTFGKRIFTVPAFIASLQEILDHLGDVKDAAQSGRVDRAFAERIMLAVTQVNGCRYCSFVHTRAALLAGVTPEEIQAIARRETGAIPPEQAIALMFAQHYADTGGHPDADAWRRLVDNCGPDTARDVIAYIRMISLANLWGNTFDAVLSRLTGRPASGSGLWQELSVVVGWVVIVPGCMVRRWMGDPFARRVGK